MSRPPLSEAAGVATVIPLRATPATTRRACARKGRAHVKGEREELGTTFEMDEDGLCSVVVYAPEQTAGTEDGEYLATTLFLLTPKSIAALEAAVALAKMRLLAKGGAS